MKMKAKILVAVAAATVVLPFACLAETAPAAPERIKIVAIAESYVTNNYIKSGRNATKALAEAGYLPVILPNVTNDSLLACAMDHADALVLTGSVPGEGPERTQFERRLIRMALDRGLPVLGFCHGHQCINKYFGGTITKMPDTRTPFIEHRSKQSPSVRHCFHMIDITPGSRLAQGLGATRYKVNSSHSFSVTKVGKGLVVTARSEDGIVEALEHESLPVTGFQFHPEAIFDLDPRFLRIIRDAIEHPLARRR